eukprot:GHVU01096312.1.p1 GENE.GHVU01096312.1~~GHVU01096312.1.p1  ORF type:complete len:335 (+),score=84.54 GHVU01096312.1:357-1361(+)
MVNSTVDSDSGLRVAKEEVTMDDNNYSSSVNESGSSNMKHDNEPVMEKSTDESGGGSSPPESQEQQQPEQPRADGLGGPKKPRGDNRRRDGGRPLIPVEGEEEDDSDSGSDDEAGAEEESDDEADEPIDDGTFQGKEKGKEAFAKGDYAEACKLWQQTLRSCNFVLSKNAYGGKELEDLQNLKLTLNLNLAMGNIKLRDFSGAITFADAALQQDPANIKAVYRKAKAHLERSEYDECVRVINYASPEANVGSNSEVTTLKLTAQHKIKEHLAKEKRMAQKIMGGFAATAASDEKEKGSFFSLATIKAAFSCLLKPIMAPFSYCKRKRPAPKKTD